LDKNSLNENRIKLLEEQVRRLTNEHKALSKIYVEKVKPVCDAFYWYNEFKEEEKQNMVGYHG
jgi:hypothetical protein